MMPAACPRAPRLGGQIRHLWLWPWQDTRRCFFCGAFSQLKVGENTITGSPAGVGDVFRWSATKLAVAIGDIGMDKTTGRPSFFTNGAAWAAIYQGEGAAWTTVTKTTTYSAVVGEFVLFDTSGGGWTLTLPDAALSAYGSIVVKKISSDANVLTIDTDGGNIDDEASATMSAQYDAAMFTSDGTDWWVS